MSAISLYDSPSVTRRVKTSRCSGESPPIAAWTRASVSPATTLSSAVYSVNASPSSTDTRSGRRRSARRRSSISRRSIVNSHVRSELSPRNDSIDANARTNVSCTNSSTSVRSPTLAANRASASEWRSTNAVAARWSPASQRVISARSTSSAADRGSPPGGIRSSDGVGVETLTAKSLALSWSRPVRCRPVEIIAHRGAPRQHAENTLPGFAQALAWGVNGIELDVWRTRDGVVVVHHDPASRGQPPISTLPAAVLVPEIPTLAAVLAAVDGRATVYVEIKQPGIEDDVLEVIAGSPTPCAIHSFDHRVAARVTSRRATVPTGVLVSSYLIDPAAALRAAGARDWWQAWEFIDRTLVE